MRILLCLSFVKSEFLKISKGCKSRRSISAPSSARTSKLEMSIRDVVLESPPQLSKYELHRKLLQQYPEESIGLQGIYNALVRLNLNTPEKRRIYQEVRKKDNRAWADRISPGDRKKAVERVLRGRL